jgi:subfamily B ATP-binding cassette protein MsbA
MGHARELNLIWPYMRPRWRAVAVMVAVSFLLAVIDVPIPWYIKHLVDDVLRSREQRELFGFDVPWSRTTLLHVIFGFLLANAMLKGLLVFAQRASTERVGQGIVHDLRVDLWRHLQGLDLAFFRESSTGQLMLRFMGDIGSVLDFITDGLLRVFMDTVTVAVVVACLFVVDVNLALIATCFVPLYVWPFVRWSPKIRQASHEARDERAKLSGNIQEKVAGIAVVKAFAQEVREQSRFERLSAGVRDLMTERARWSGRVNGMAQFAIALCAALILWLGGLRAMEPGMTRGDLMAFYVLATLLFPPLRRLARVNDVFQQATVSLQRIREFRDGSERHRETRGSCDLVVTSGDVEFDHVSFDYPEDHPVLEDVTFRVGGGQVVAIVGPNGAGKTTLVSLIPRFFEPKRGAIRIDGQDIADVELATLRRHVGVVGQDTHLFSGSIRKNIAYGRPDATREEIEQAAHVANASEFIGAFRRGMEQRVGERGSKLSGGQRQRIAIARAVLRDPRILILDEATSAVDAESEALIQEALQRVMRGRTTFVIAHRMSTVRRADLILVLERGRLVESGTHAELLRRGGAYARLCREQLISDDPAPVAASSPRLVAP